MVSTIGGKHNTGGSVVRARRAQAVKAKAVTYGGDGVLEFGESATEGGGAKYRVVQVSHAQLCAVPTLPGFRGGACCVFSLSGLAWQRRVHGPPCKAAAGTGALRQYLAVSRIQTQKTNVLQGLTTVSCMAAGGVRRMPRGAG